MCSEGVLKQSEEVLKCMAPIGRSVASLNELWERLIRQNQNCYFFKPGIKGDGIKGQILFHSTACLPVWCFCPWPFGTLVLLNTSVIQMSEDVLSLCHPVNEGEKQWALTGPNLLSFSQYGQRWDYDYWLEWMAWSLPVQPFAQHGGNCPPLEALPCRSGFFLFVLFFTFKCYKWL